MTAAGRCGTIGAVPFLAGTTGRLHYRHRPVDGAVAALVFAHGIRQHTGNYHRFAHRLAGHGIALWGLDLAGHGLSEGEPDAAGDVAAHAADLALLAGIAETDGLPAVVMGHSLGAASVLRLLCDGDADRFAAAVLCGTPRTAAVAATAEALAELRLPVLAVHGVDDRLAPVDSVRDWASAIRTVRWREYADAGHDLLHEPVHRVVTDDVAAFVLDATRRAPVRSVPGRGAERVPRAERGTCGQE